MEGIDFSQFPGVVSGYIVFTDDRVIRLSDGKEFGDSSSKADCERVGADFGFLELTVNSKMLGTDSNRVDIIMEEPDMEGPENLRGSVLSCLANLFKGKLDINVC